MYIQKIILLVLISKFSDKKCFYNFDKKKNAMKCLSALEKHLQVGGYTQKLLGST